MNKSCSTKHLLSLVLCTGFPDEISIKSQTVLKRGQKGQTHCLKARKKANFVCGVAFPLSHRNI